MSEAAALPSALRSGSVRGQLAPLESLESSHVPWPERVARCARWSVAQGWLAPPGRNFELKDLHPASPVAMTQDMEPGEAYRPTTPGQLDTLSGTRKTEFHGTAQSHPSAPFALHGLQSSSSAVSQAERGESEPEPDTFEPPEAPETPRSEPNSLLLEIRGVTSHPRQGVMWEKELVFKESILAKLRGIGKPDLAGKMAECHTIESLKRCTGCRRVSRFFNRCELFFCPVCAPRLARERKQSVEWWTKQVKQPKHLVLTVRNTLDLTKPYVQFLKSQLAKLRRSKALSSVKGGFYSMEVTNEGRGWHVHFHLLIDTPWLCMPDVSETWGKLVGQDFAICKIKDCRGASYLQEVTKYAVKGSELAGWNGLTISEFITAFAGVRFFGVFGTLYGKRSEWREWIKSIQEIKPLCPCGCDSWHILSPEELLWEQETRGGLTGQPPPTLRQVPNNQRDLALGGTETFAWPD